MPSEKCAYALARYSRSPDSIRQSIEWVRTHNSQSFLESFYFQYGHASIADLGHVVVCFEGMSELAATEIEDENLWDGQAKSSRYQDFSRSGFVTPPELSGADAATYAPIKRIGTASLESASAGASSEGPVATFVPDFDAINRAIPKSGLSAARVPAAHVPTPSGNALSSSNAGFSGFNGLSQR